jgi:hypothetical protein
MAVAQMPLAGTPRTHIYHGEANLFELDVLTPFEEKITPQAKLELYGGGERNHYLFQPAGPYRVRGIASYEGGYTQVAGNRSLKHEGRFSTLTTSVLEGLNILDILTADRVVAQISTAHPIDGAVPEVSFLGTRFENLRIAGHEIKCETNLNILGPRPVKDQCYFDNTTVMDEMEKQYLNLGAGDYFPDWATERYPRDKQNWKVTDDGVDVAKCSLVNRVNSDQTCFGHVIDVPHFGKFFLAELQVTRTPGDRAKKEYDAYNFHVTMIRMELGCSTTANGGASSAESNGKGQGGGG